MPLVRFADGSTRVVSDGEAACLSMRGPFYVPHLAARLGVDPEVLVERLNRGQLGPCEFVGKGEWKVSQDLIDRGVDGYGRLRPDPDADDEEAASWSMGGGPPAASSELEVVERHVPGGDYLT